MKDNEITEIEISEAEVDAPSVPEWHAQLPLAIRQAFTLSPPPNEGELEACVAQLPEALQTNFRNMMQSLSPVREGVLTTQLDARIPRATIAQGVSQDTARPAGTPPGAIYKPDQILMIPDPGLARLNQVPTSFDVAVLAMLEGNTWWVPRDPAWVPPAGVDANARGVICQSFDRHMGTRFGACKACPHRPYKTPGSFDKNSCTPDATLFLLRRDFSDIYMMTVKGASLVGAVAVVRRQTKPLSSIYFTVGTKKNENKHGQWYTLTLSISPDGPPTEAESAVIRVMSRMIINGPVMNLFARVYDPSLRQPVTLDNGMADMAALTDGAANADYSKNTL